MRRIGSKTIIYTGGISTAWRRWCSADQGKSPKQEVSFQSGPMEFEGGFESGVLTGFVDETKEKPKDGPLPCQSENPPKRSLYGSNPYAQQPAGSSSGASKIPLNSNKGIPLAKDRRAETAPQSSTVGADGQERCSSHPRNHVTPESEAEQPFVKPGSTQEMLPEQLRRQFPHGEMTKEEMWTRMREASRQQALDEQRKVTTKPTEVDYYKIETDVKDDDPFHWRLGQMAIDDQQTRFDYYSLQALAHCLNKARWKHLEQQNEKGMGSMGVAMRSMFWKESCHTIINSGKMVSGQFTDGHPILRPFADIFSRHKLTKTFLRGFVDARLINVNQPGNMKQLLDLFDKSYGFFFATQLELLGVRDEHAEHVMLHIGRAVGLLQHCVLLWRKYAEYGVTMLPADICADNKVSLTLLRHKKLAATDRGIRYCIYDVMCQVKAEMSHVEDLMPLFPTAGWPVLYEALLPAYYLKFLQKNDFDVRKWHIEDFMYGPGFMWFAYKKNVQWKLNHRVEDLVTESAPWPGLGMIWKARKSTYDERAVECGASVAKKF